MQRKTIEVAVVFISKLDVAEVLTDGVAAMLVDMSTGEIYHATPPMEEMFGCQIKGQLVGMNVDVLVPESLRNAHADLRKDFAKSPQARLMGPRPKIQGSKIDGTLFEVNLRLKAYRLSSGTNVVLVVAMLPNCQAGEQK